MRRLVVDGADLLAAGSAPTALGAGGVLVSARLAEVAALLADVDDDVLLLASDAVVPDGALRLLAGTSVAALTRAATVAHPVVTAGGRVVTAGTTIHPVVGPTSGSLGAIFVPAADAAAVGSVLARAAELDGPEADPADPGLADLDVTDLDVADLALAALVRSGIAVTAVAIEPFPGDRAHSADDAQRLRAEIDAADLNRLARLRSSRGQDGFYSTFVLRKLSRPISGWGAAHGVSANSVTALSGVIGVLAVVLFGTGSFAGLVAGGLLLQLSLILDCVDGEIARATQTFSPFGAWLDASLDRVKEYGALAGLAVGAGRHGHDLWLIALAGMVLQTARHVQDFGFDKGVLAAWRAPQIDLRPLTDHTPFINSVPASVPSQSGASVWVRRVIHMPIAERWLVLSVGAVLGRPLWALLAYLVLTALAGAWALAGALRRSLSTSAAYPVGLRDVLARYRDDGLLTSVVRDRGPGGTGGWLLPVAVTALEGAVVLLAAAADGYATRVWAFAWFAALAWHRYDLIYRWRDRGLSVPSWATRTGGGWAVRIAVIAVAWAAGALTPVLAIGAVWLALVYVPESVRAGAESWRGPRSAVPAREVTV
jgi:uncharacterized protein DUF5941/CDP-alcohol phosphatidyltransferase-like enzyme